MKNQRGAIIPMLIAGVVALSVLSSLALLYVNSAKTGNTVTLRATSGELLTQASYTLTTEASDSDGDGYSESTAGAVVLGDGWTVPATSGAPKADAWGQALKYCPWDNGTTNSSTGRLTGDTPGAQSSVVFAVISSGPDKAFNTTCAQAKAGTVLGDDGMRVKTQAQVVQGVGGTVYYGDPVSTSAALPTTGNKTGTLRQALDTGIVYAWNGTAWYPLSADKNGNMTLAGTATMANAVITGTATAGGACSPNGKLAQDGTGLPLSCQSGSWATGSGVPSGLYGFFNASACPGGWIAANGSSGTLDLRGEFIRGWDNGRSIDTGRTLGSWQADQFQGHQHTLGLFTNGGGGADAYRLTYSYAGAVAKYGPWYASEGVKDPISDGVNGTPRTGTETRPRNVALLACMKQ